MRGVNEPRTFIANLFLYKKEFNEKKANILLDPGNPFHFDGRSVKRWEKGTAGADSKCIA